MKCAGQSVLWTNVVSVQILLILGNLKLIYGSPVVAIPNNKSSIAYIEKIGIAKKLSILPCWSQVDGSVVLWDLREVSMMHRPLKIDDIEYTLRYPTYNTAGVLQDENHESPCVALQPITAPGDRWEERACVYAI